MASHGTVHPDTPIRTKVTFNGSTRRFKFNLRDLGANVLLGKLRALLLIPDDQQVIFERYSDSSGGYILLDPKDPTAFKQLFRAARAKLKLRIQATLIPVDVPQADTSSTETDTQHKHVLPSESSCSFPVNPFLTLSPAYASKASLALDLPFEELATVEENKFPRVSPDELDKAVASAVSNFLDGEEYLQKLRETVREEVEKLDRNVSEAPVPASFTAPLVESPQESGDMEVKVNSRCSTYAIYCNVCEMNIYDVHYHCSVCDSGDYDLCQACVDRGIHCNDSTHWLIKRMLSATGSIVVSTTFIKQKAKQKEPEKEVSEPAASSPRLTCNSCVTERPRKDFVTCKVCEDYDICVPCHIAVKHGHNPSHEFVPATPETMLESRAVSLLAPGRGRRHYASCDGCDQQIYGVRHKCLNCPDWDYCSKCITTAPENHPGHRFVPIYDPLPIFCTAGSSVQHDGIYCDGPLCARINNRSRIVGARYKCAICPDLDFCASCEACPTNQHNPTHPLIKLKTPVRNVHVTTMGDGDAENVMGDDPVDGLTNSRRSSTTATNPATQLQTVAEVKPAEELEPPFENVEEYPKESAPAASVEGEGELEEQEGAEVEAEPESAPIPEPAPAPLQATFVRDTIPDGSEMALGQEFTQTWILNNSGTTTWPAGVSVACVGGDDMLNKNTMGTTAMLPTPPGCHAAFSINLKATSLASRHQISYWRLTSPDGARFGDKLWCEIMVVEKNTKEDKMEQSILESKDEFEDVSEHANDGSQASSQMIFPKLPVESPVASTENLVSGVSLKVEDEPVSAPMSIASTGLGEDDSEVEVGSLSDGVESFLTDDEYDVLDASDEEAFQECERIG